MKSIPRNRPDLAAWHQPVAVAAVDEPVPAMTSIGRVQVFPK